MLCASGPWLWLGPDINLLVVLRVCVRFLETSYQTNVLAYLALVQRPGIAMVSLGISGGRIYIWPLSVARTTEW